MTIKNIVIRKKLEGTATEILYPVTSIENVTGLSSLLTTINTNLAGKSDTGHKHEWSDINTGKDKPIRIDNFKNSALHRTVSLGTGNNLKAYNNWTADEKNGGHRIWTIRFPTNNGNTSPKFWGKIKISFISSYSSFNASGLISKEINISFNGGALYNNVGRYVDLSGNIENDFRISELILNTSLNCWEIKIYSEKASGNNTPKDVTIEGWFTAASYENTLKGIEFITTPEISKDTTYTATLATVTNITSNGVTLGTKVVNWSDTPRFETPYGREIATVQEMVRSVNGQTPDASGNVSLTIPDISTLQQTLTNKRDIVTATNQVYTTGSTAGTQSSIGFSDAAVNSTIVRRTANGRIKAANAIENGDLTTFGQVVRATTEDKNILGTTQSVFNISEKKVWFNKGALFYGTAAAAGLVTRGISGVKTDGSAKDHLYINYDGNNTLSRQLVLGAGSIGTARGHGIYDYSAVRGDAFIAYLTNTLGSYEKIANKRTSIRTSGADDTSYVSELGVKKYVDGLIGSVYRPAGDWNANTNTPALANNTPANAGKVYRVSVAGTRFGFTFAVGDKLAFNESGVISKWDNIDDVTSVNGQTGTVNLTTDNVPQGSNLYVSQGEKNKLSGIQAGAQVNKIESISLGSEALTISSSKNVSIPTVPIHAWAMGENKPSYNLDEISDDETTYKKVTQSEKNIWNAKQNALGFTPENVANKKASWSSTVSDTNYPSEKLVKVSLDSKVDKVTGKGLSTNDYTNIDKQRVGKIPTIEQNISDLESNKVDKVSGKGLSTNDFTTTEKNKLSGIQTGAQVNKIESISLDSVELPISSNKDVVIPTIPIYAWAMKPDLDLEDVPILPISKITDLQDELDGKAPLSHEHTISDVSGLQGALDNKANTSHTHAYTNITGLETNKVLGRTTSGTGEVQAIDTVNINQIKVSDLDESSLYALKTDIPTAVTNIATQRLLGRYSTGTGNVQPITLGSNLTLSTGGVLSATNTVYTHPNSGVTAGTYRSVTVNSQGHVTTGTNPTTLTGYGITLSGDVTNSNNVITIGPKKVTLSKIQDIPTNKVLGRTTGGTGEVQALDMIDINDLDLGAGTGWTEVWSGSINLNSYRGSYYTTPVPSGSYIGKRIAIEVQYGTGTTYTSKIIFGVLGSSSTTTASTSISRGIGWSYFDGTNLRVKTLYAYASASNTTTIYVGYLKTLFGSFTGTTIEWSTSYSETLYMKKIWVIE